MVKITDKQKPEDMRSIAESANFEQGLPFTLDLKRMIDKSIKNLSMDNLQYLNEMAGFALESNPSRVDINDNGDGIEIVFEGPGIASKDDLKSVLMHIYNSEDENKDIERFGKLGRFVVSSLKTKPLEVIIKTHDDKSAYMMKIDSRLEPAIHPLDKTSSKNSLKIVKHRRKSLSIFEAMKWSSLSKAYRYALTTSVTHSALDIAGGISNLIEENIAVPLNSLMNSHFKKLNFSRTKARLEDLCMFSNIPVYLNRKKINRGFTFPDNIYEKEYKFGDINILVSMPKSNKITRGKRRTVYLKNRVFMYQNFNYLENHDYFTRPLILNIAVEAPKLKMTLSGEKVIGNRYFNSLNEKVDKARHMFNMDVLENLEKLDNEAQEDINDFVIALLYSDRIHSRKDTRLDRLKLFSDIHGKKYTLGEVDDIAKKQNDRLFTTRKKVRLNHPKLKGIDGVIFYLESDNKNSLFEKICGSYPNSVTDIGRRVEQYDSDQRNQRIRSMNRILKSAVKKCGYTATLGTTAAASYLGTAFLLPHMIEYWYYGAMAAGGAGGLYITCKGSAAAARRIANGTPIAMQHTLTGLNKTTDLINYKGWINRSVGRCSDFFYNSIRRIEDIIDKRRANTIENKHKTGEDKNEPGPIEIPGSLSRIGNFMLNMLIKKRYLIAPEFENKDKVWERIGNLEKEYISALKKDIYQKNGSNFGDYFSSIKHVSVMDRGIFSPLFSVRKQKYGGASDYDLIINSSKKSLYKKAKMFNESRSSIYYDLFNISNILKKKGAWTPKEDNLEKSILDAAHMSVLDDVIESCSKGKDSFKEDFLMLSSCEKRNIIKRILANDITLPDNAADWLIQNHSSELEKAAKESMTGAYFERIMKHLENNMLGTVKYEYDLLPVREKLDFIPKIKEKAEMEEYGQASSLLSYIRSNDDMIYAYHDLIYGKLIDLQSEHNSGRRVPAFKFKRITKSLKSLYHAGDSLTNILQTDSRHFSAKAKAIVANVFPRPRNEWPKLLDMCRYKIPEKQYSQLEEVMKISLDYKDYRK